MGESLRGPAIGLIASAMLEAALQLVFSRRRQPRLQGHTYCKYTTSSSLQSEGSRALSMLRARPKKPSVTTSAVETFKRQIVHYIVESNVAFNAISHATFQRLIRTPIELIEAAIPLSQQIVKSWFMKDYSEPNNASNNRYSLPGR
ncbi:hypothetical protein B0T10DRAFT_464700 [Thelonectria olida]|uniref:Uncharacterized protein n=1 Tax=Thelonectria olida TaxID=1576542 RepID=A0A9P8VUV0_9HYPO|nr:hypothetical protein B0T10DRAFT_464700 [Thelonectria olida]